MVMEGLKALDPVAYIRFATVYKDFREAKDFEDFAGTVREVGEGVTLHRRPSSSSAPSSARISARRRGRCSISG